MAMLKILRRAGLILGDGRHHNFTALAAALGCHRSSLYIWKQVPVKYVEKIVDATGGAIKPHEIRPDLFAAPDGSVKPSKRSKAKRK